MNKLNILFVGLIIIAMVVVVVSGCTTNKTFEQRRESVLDEVNLAIEDAVNQGKYKCCIEPACTMCYMGDWIWDDGTCDCDGMIAEGEWDKVCPQCKRGIKEGQCKSSEIECELPEEIYG